MPEGLFHNSESESINHFYKIPVRVTGRPINLLNIILEIDGTTLGLFVSWTSWKLILNCFRIYWLSGWLLKHTVPGNVYIKFWRVRTCNFIKKRLQHRCFPEKFFEIIFFFYGTSPVPASEGISDTPYNPVS